MELALVEICVNKILQEQFPDKSKDSTERLQAESVEVPLFMLQNAEERCRQRTSAW